MGEQDTLRGAYLPKVWSAFLMTGGLKVFTNLDEIRGRSLPHLVTMFQQKQCAVLHDRI
jgi:hypothetical protein